MLFPDKTRPVDSPSSSTASESLYSMAKRTRGGRNGRTNSLPATDLGGADAHAENHGTTVERIVLYLTNRSAWSDSLTEELLCWPPDVFGIVAFILRRSSTYLSLINNDGLGPVDADQIRTIGEQWAIDDKTQPPPQVRKWWQTLYEHRATQLPELFEVLGPNGDDSSERLRTLQVALLNLCAAADEAMAGVGVGVKNFEQLPMGALKMLRLAYKYLTNQDVTGSDEPLRTARGESLCRAIDTNKIVVFPKMRTPQTGINIRSLTHHLALLRGGEVRTGWTAVADKRYHVALRSTRILVFPWPRQIFPTQFTDITPQTMPAKWCEKFGYFNYVPHDLQPEDFARFERLFLSASAQCGRIDGVIWPELALTEPDFDKISGRLAQHGVSWVVGGIGASSKRTLPRGLNHAKIVTYSPTDTQLSDKRTWPERESAQELKMTLTTQAKHHRWRLDGRQIRQYGLGAVLDPRRMWWEWIDIPRRNVEFIALGPCLTMSVLICEDLAQSDPISDAIRAIGPNLVVALLADGPQLAGRWPGRYASVLADDPGSSVLTVTSAGMSRLSRPSGTAAAKADAVVLWKDPITGLHEISLPSADTEGIVLSLSLEEDEQFTADFRSDDKSTTTLTLGGVHFLRG
ncbi:MAG: hypothetical protein SFU86_23325 [Pirellulaceae bacterium]|nr:hypothetical protein [Pirellulaceae bacterium]